MKKFFIDGKEIELKEDNLPMLVHGEDHAGASFYTISLIANLFLQGSKIIVLCGYFMAEEQFRKQVGDFSGEAIFYTKDHVSDFKKFVSSIQDSGHLILLKNIELFDEETVNFVLNNKKYIISGDFNKCVFRDKILEKSFTTKIFFSQLPGVDMPSYNQYEGFFVSDTLRGITKVEV